MGPRIAVSFCADVGGVRAGGGTAGAMTTRAARAVAAVPSERPTKVKSRDISRAVEAMLWGRAAGCCQFDGCNRPLWKSPVTQERVNLAEKAHIYSFSADGPRGNGGVDAKRLNALENLILVCDICHKTIDRNWSSDRYTTAQLQQWKAAHEARVSRRQAAREKDLVFDPEPAHFLAQSLAIKFVRARPGQHQDRVWMCPDDFGHLHQDPALVLYRIDSPDDQHNFPPAQRGVGVESG